MITVTIAGHADFEEWRKAARLLLQNDIRPEDVDWSGPNRPASLFAQAGTPISSLLPREKAVTVPPAFIDAAKLTICHSDPERFARLYTLLFRMQSERGLIGSAVDPDIIWLTACSKAVRRDRHKMHAFVRFRKVGEGRFRREQFAAWFEPSHYITQLATPFFKRRFPNMDWVIVTPHCTAIWDGKDLTFGAGGQASDVPPNDALEDHWKVYFNSIFNPARLKVGAMMSEMPKKYWKNMPEAVDISGMIKTAQERQRHMQISGVTEPHPLAQTLAQRASKSEPLHPEISLADAKRAVKSCKRCPLHCYASQAVFGEGPADADVMIVGEQPGDQEDIAGRPFVGPAGQVLDRALDEAGINRGETYVTNAVKHFKFKPRGKRRIHERPSAGEIDHCRWWLDIERKHVAPKIIIALGASAARGILGRSVKISDVRGTPIALPGGEQLLVTVHPSYLLRMPDARRKALERAAFIDDLKTAKQIVSHGVKA